MQTQPEAFVVPVYIGRGKTGTAKTGERNVQTATDEGFDRLRILSKRIAAVPGVEVDATTISRQLLDLFPSDSHVCELGCKEVGAVLYMYRAGDDNAERAVARRVQSL